MRTLPSDCCLIGRDSRGRWVVRGPHNRYGGFFISRAAAFRFAMLEYGTKPQAVIMVPGTLEFVCGG